MAAGLCLLLGTAVGAAEDAFPQDPGFHNLRFDGTVPMAYGIYVPAGYDGREARPLFVFMHGVGQCGTDWGGLYVLGTLGELKAHPQLQEGFESLVLAPQCPPRGQRWDQPQMDRDVLDLIDLVEQHWKVDTSRVYIGGLSMGAKGSCAVAAMAPDRFAGIAPMSLDGFMPNMDVLSKMAVWNVSGDADPNSIKIARAVPGRDMRAGPGRISAIRRCINGCWSTGGAGRRRAPRGRCRTRRRG
jgi:predicted peptidase